MVLKNSDAGLDVFLNETMKQIKKLEMGVVKRTMSGGFGRVQNCVLKNYSPTHKVLTLRGRNL